MSYTSILLASLGLGLSALGLSPWLSYPLFVVAAAAVGVVVGGALERFLLQRIYRHEEALQLLKKQIAALKAGGTSTIDVGMFKERFGVTRKFAIPLLEYLDRERVTRRAGEKRLIL